MAYSYNENSAMVKAARKGGLIGLIHHVAERSAQKAEQAKYETGKNGSKHHHYDRRGLAPNHSPATPRDSVVCEILDPDHGWVRWTLLANGKARTHRGTPVFLSAKYGLPAAKPARGPIPRHATRRPTADELEEAAKAGHMIGRHDAHDDRP